ncbi:MAG: Sec-independent protein translocase protein TatB [Gammaproteobacteria bacterium]|nr:Sec-independent protein translocase protein TatB [Gammaproteobacteria bacterium]
MFDFGFWEVAIVMVVALLVVGPERLPALAGQIGKWVGKAKRMIASVRSDIESEIKAAELKEILEKQQGEIGELKEMLKGTKNEIEKELDFENEDQGDSELIRAVENHIESTKQQELSLSSEKSPEISANSKRDDD